MTFRPSVAVFDYGIGNLRSAQKALEFAGAEAILTNDKSILKEAEVYERRNKALDEQIGAHSATIRDYKLKIDRDHHHDQDPSEPSPT